MFRIGLAVYDIEQNGFHVLHKDSWEWDCKGDSDEFAEKSEMFLKDVEEIADSVGNIFGKLLIRNMCFLPIIEKCELGDLVEHDGSYCSQPPQLICSDFLENGKILNPHTICKLAVVWNSEMGKWRLRFHSDNCRNIEQEYQDTSDNWRTVSNDLTLKVDVLAKLVQELRGNLINMQSELNVAGHEDSYRSGHENGYESCIEDVDLLLKVAIDDLLNLKIKKIDFKKLLEKFVA